MENNNQLKIFESRRKWNLLLAKMFEKMEADEEMMKRVEESREKLEKEVEEYLK